MMKKLMFFVFILCFAGISFASAENQCKWNQIESGIYIESPICKSNNFGCFSGSISSISNGLFFEGAFFQGNVKNQSQNQPFNRFFSKENPGVLKLDAAKREELLKTEVWIVTTLTFRNNIDARYGGAGEIIKKVKNKDTMTLYVLTAAHVVGNAVREIKDAKVSIVIGEKFFPAEVLKKGENYGVNWEYEMILLKTEVPLNNNTESAIKVLELSQNDIKWGMNVYVVGFPAKIAKASEGYVALMGNLSGPTVLPNGSAFYVKYFLGIETYGIVAGGISGGAVIDEDGRLAAVIWGEFPGEPFALATPIDANSREWINNWIK